VRVKFIGPADAKFAGHELVGITPDKAAIRHVAAIQMATGWKLPELNKNLLEYELVGTQAVMFLTLRTAGFFVSWDEAGDLTEADVQTIQEPGDAGPQPDAGGAEVDPTPARTDSVPGEVPDAALPPAPLKPARTPSKPRSVPAS
jgi:hypothetical protein